jgi:hypothetical protein
MRYERFKLKKAYSEDDIDGIILFENKDFVELLLERDFQFEGYQVIAKRAIVKRIKQPKSGFYSRVLEKEGAYKKYLKPVRFSNLQSLIKRLMKTEKFIILERRTGYFDLGPVIEINDKMLKLQSITPNGKNDTIDTIELRRIFSVKWQNSYLKRFEKFANKL